MNRLRNFRNKIKPRGGWRYPAIIISGAFVGLFAYTFFCIKGLQLSIQRPCDLR